ncbi:MAG TPA: hypothetical protein VHW92_03110 [Mycobacteriales bacterium]|jgi:hypothetical protein|nr:hypothetical protein [Mycobacteriales bacterium]
MNGTLVAVGVLVLVVAVVLAGYATARSRSRGVRPGSPDRVSEDVVSGLMAELKKWQAEAAYWKSTAQRLQRQLDDR